MSEKYDTVFEDEKLYEEQRFKKKDAILYIFLLGLIILISYIIFVIRPLG